MAGESATPAPAAAPPVPPGRKGPVAFAAGATSGALTAAVLQPLDVLRTRLQTSASGTSLVAATRGVS